jgi:hypothetical protein
MLSTFPGKLTKFLWISHSLPPKNNYAVSPRMYCLNPLVMMLYFQRPYSECGSSKMNAALLLTVR